jgi:hypothetical protein
LSLGKIFGGCFNDYKQQMKKPWLILVVLCSLFKTSNSALAQIWGLIDNVTLKIHEKARIMPKIKVLSQGVGCEVSKISFARMVGKGYSTA